VQLIKILLVPSTLGQHLTFFMAQSMLLCSLHPSHAGIVLKQLNLGWCRAYNKTIFLAISRSLTKFGGYHHQCNSWHSKTIWSYYCLFFVFPCCVIKEVLAVRCHLYSVKYFMKWPGIISVYSLLFVWSVVEATVLVLLCLFSRRLAENCTLDCLSAWTWLMSRWSFWRHMNTCLHWLVLTSSNHNWGLRVGLTHQKTLTSSHTGLLCQTQDTKVQRHLLY